MLFVFTFHAQYQAQKAIMRDRGSSTVSFVTPLWRDIRTKRKKTKKKRRKPPRERRLDLRTFFATQTRRTLHLNPKMNSFYAMNYSKLAIRTRILFIVSHVTSTRVRNRNLGCECDWHVSRQVVAFPPELPSATSRGDPVADLARRWRGKTCSFEDRGSQIAMYTNRVGLILLFPPTGTARGETRRKSSQNGYAKTRGAIYGEAYIATNQLDGNVSSALRILSSSVYRQLGYLSRMQLYQMINLTIDVDRYLDQIRARDESQTADLTRPKGK